MRRVSGDVRGHRNRHPKCDITRLTPIRRIASPARAEKPPPNRRSAGRGPPGGGSASGASAGAVSGGRIRASAVAVSIANAIERFDLREIVVHRLELLAQPLDVAVDRAV